MDAFKHDLKILGIGLLVLLVLIFVVGLFKLLFILGIFTLGYVLGVTSARRGRAAKEPKQT